jgi:hypothetical protein
VIFRTPYISTLFLDKTRYIQMSGRAGKRFLILGRAGIKRYNLKDLMKLENHFYY